VNNFKTCRRYKIRFNRDSTESCEKETSLNLTINLLKLTAYVMHQPFEYSRILHSAHTVILCFVFISEQTATLAMYNTDCLVFITEMRTVYCAVRTVSFNKAVCASPLKI
jgi:hypothetical protein